MNEVDFKVLTFSFIFHAREPSSSFRFSACHVALTLGALLRKMRVQIPTGSRKPLAHAKVSEARRLTRCAVVYSSRHRRCWSGAWVIRSGGIRKCSALSAGYRRLVQPAGRAAVSAQSVPTTTTRFPKTVSKNRSERLSSSCLLSFVSRWRRHAELGTFCIRHDGYCIKIDEFCIKNDEFCIKHDGYCIKNDELQRYHTAPRQLRVEHRGNHLRKGGVSRLRRSRRRKRKRRLVRSFIDSRPILWLICATDLCTGNTRESIALRGAKRKLRKRTINHTP